MYAKFRVTECVLDPKIVKNFLGGSAPEPPAGYPFSDVRASAVLGESLPSACRTGCVARRCPGFGARGRKMMEFLLVCAVIIRRFVQKRNEV